MWADDDLLLICVVLVADREMTRSRLILGYRKARRCLPKCVVPINIFANTSVIVEPGEMINADRGRGMVVMRMVERRGGNSSAGPPDDFLIKFFFWEIYMYINICI